MCACEFVCECACVCVHTCVRVCVRLHACMYVCMGMRSLACYDRPIGAWRATMGRDGLVATVIG